MERNSTWRNEDRTTIILRQRTARRALLPNAARRLAIATGIDATPGSAMELAKRTQVQTVKPGRTALRRGILFTILTIFCVICFWYALSGVNSPPCPLSVGQGTDSSACSTGSGGQARPSGLGAILSGQANSKTMLSTGNSHVPVGSQPTPGGSNRGGGQSLNPAAGSSITSVSAGGLAMSNAASLGSSGSSNPLTCRSQCQTSGLTCQTACARQYNVTNRDSELGDVYANVRFKDECVRQFVS